MENSIQAESSENRERSFLSQTCSKLKVNKDLKDNDLINNGLNKLITSFTESGKKNRSRLPIKRDFSGSNLKSSSACALDKKISVDKFTMTDFKEDEIIKLNFQNMVKGDSPKEHVLDQRLLKRYLIIPNPKNETDDKSDMESVINDPLEDLEETHYSLGMRIVFYFLSMSSIVIGALFGILIMAVVAQQVVQQKVFEYNSKPVEDSFPVKVFKFCTGIVIHAIDSTWNMVHKVFTMTAKEFLSSN